jgi:phosphocarrier protein HPr
MIKKFEYVIKDECGIHARPAGLLVKQAKLFKSNITVIKGEESADAKKLFALMGLCVKKDDKVNVTADGPDEAEAIQAVEDFFNKNL